MRGVPPAHLMPVWVPLAVMPHLFVDPMIVFIYPIFNFIAQILTISEAVLVLDVTGISV